MDAYAQGARSALDDGDAVDAADFSENPYTEGSLAHKRWDAGYAYMSEHIRQNSQAILNTPHKYRK